MPHAARRREITIHVDRRDYIVRADVAATAIEWQRVIQETMAKYKVHTAHAHRTRTRARGRWRSTRAAKGRSGACSMT
jgi:hypothetical protein